MASTPPLPPYITAQHPLPHTILPSALTPPPAYSHLRHTSPPGSLSTTITFTTSPPPTGTDADACALRTAHPIPPGVGLAVYYYEARVMGTGPEGYMSIGFMRGDSHLRRLVGWDRGTWGYHADDGKVFEGSGSGRAMGPAWTDGDVVGAGIDFTDNRVFFTKNGKFLARGIRPTESGLYPAIALRNPLESLSVNLGAEPFLYDIDQHVARIRDRVQAEIASRPITHAPVVCAERNPPPAPRSSSSRSRTAPLKFARTLLPRAGASGVVHDTAADAAVVHAHEDVELGSDSEPETVLILRLGGGANSTAIRPLQIVLDHMRTNRGPTPLASLLSSVGDDAASVDRPRAGPSRARMRLADRTAVIAALTSAPTSSLEPHASSSSSSADHTARCLLSTAGPLESTQLAFVLEHLAHSGMTSVLDKIQAELLRRQSRVRDAPSQAGGAPTMTAEATAAATGDPTAGPRALAHLDLGPVLNRTAASGQLIKTVCDGLLSGKPRERERERGMPGSEDAPLSAAWAATAALDDADCAARVALLDFMAFARSVRTFARSARKHANTSGATRADEDEDEDEGEGEIGLATRLHADSDADMALIARAKELRQRAISAGWGDEAEGWIGEALSAVLHAETPKPKHGSVSVVMDVDEGMQVDGDGDGDGEGGLDREAWAVGSGTSGVGAGTDPKDAKNGAGKKSRVIGHNCEAGPHEEVDAEFGPVWAERRKAWTADIVAYLRSHRGMTQRSRLETALAQRDVMLRFMAEAGDAYAGVARGLGLGLEGCAT